ncbi:MAG: hypothetical protein LBD84_05530 [Campylobacteraceae bacterium]|nr:hypothetical protein [Campylobacteraceae bacterium]
MTRDNNSLYYTDIAQLMSYRGNIHASIALDAINYMIDETNSNKTIF